MADNKDDISCPACGSTMEKIYIESLGKHLDVCLKYCGGIFFDNREFEKVDEAHESIDEITRLYENLDVKSVNTNNDVRICPYCHAQMVKQNAQGVIIDVCYTCGGKFLDYGELEQYRGQYPNEQERSKAFASFLNNAMSSPTLIENLPVSNKKEQIVENYTVEAPSYSNGQMDEIVYCEPPPKGFFQTIERFFRKK